MSTPFSLKDAYPYQDQEEARRYAEDAGRYYHEMTQAFHLHEMQALRWLEEHGHPQPAPAPIPEPLDTPDNGA